MSNRQVGALALIVGIGIAGSIYVLFNLGLLNFTNDGDVNLEVGFGTATLEQRNLLTYTDLDGTLEYGVSSQFISNQNGVLTYIAPEGSILDRGSVLFRLYRSVSDSQHMSAEQQVASANASVTQAELALENLTASATAAQIASANASVAQAEIALENLKASATAAQVASANASVAQAEIALENLKAPATAAQVASANASLAQAEIALENLKAPATAAQVASANASLAQAEIALENLKAPATAAQVASANASVAQAESTLLLRNGTVNTAWSTRRIAHKTFCDTAAEIGMSRDEICPITTVTLTDSVIPTLKSLISDNLVVTESNSLLSAHQAYQSAVESSSHAAKSLSSAQANQAALDESPTDVQLTQATEALESAKQQRAALDEPPTDVQLTQATEALESAKQQRAALDEPPTKSQLAQATESLESAKQQRAALDEPPTKSQLAQATESLESAKQQRAALDEPPTDVQLTQATEALESAKQQRAALDEPPTKSQLAQATESLESAKQQRAALDEPPTKSQLAQATESLESAKQQRAALDEPPTDVQLENSNASIESAKASLLTAQANREDLTPGSSASVLMFGDKPAWRDFSKGMLPGDDVEQLEKNLVLLGYASSPSLVIDRVFNKETAIAITKMQEALNISVTGRIKFGDVIFLPGTTVVQSISEVATLGTTISQGTSLGSLIAMERITAAPGKDGKLAIDIQSLQSVEASIEVSEQDLIVIGTEVSIELPDETVIQGTVAEIGRIAVIPEGAQSGDPYLDVSISIERDRTLHKWTGAPVTVSVTAEIAENVLAAPIPSLLALLDGGYALEIIEPETTRLVPIETGVYSEGWVEVIGINLEPGISVVIPR